VSISSPIGPEIRFRARRSCNRAVIWENHRNLMWYFW
jgi:hypothetical protein